MVKQLDIKEYVQQEKEKLRRSGIGPLHIVIIDPTDDDAGNSLYLKGMLKDFNMLEWTSIVVRVTSQDEYESACRKYSEEKGVDAIFVLRPARKDILLYDGNIPNSLDAEGLNPIWPLVLPATVRGILDYLDACGFEYEGRDAVVLGRSKHVGKPMADELLRRNMTVSICHSRSNRQSVKDLLGPANLVISAVGQPHLFNRCDVNWDTVVVDVGINQDNSKIVGDFDERQDLLDEIKDSHGWSTPVPGGVGQLTRLALLKNCVNLRQIKSTHYI